MEISKSDESQYRHEVKEGLDVFKKSFEGGVETKKFPEKKELFEKSSKEAMQGIHDAAKALMNKEILAQKEKLEKDYDQYLEQPSPKNRKQVEKDLESFKDSLK